jgi:imidazolonepropionase-like amidohydrolase
MGNEMRNNLLSLLPAAALACVPAAPAQTNLPGATVIKAGHLLDVTRGQMLANQIILVEGERIRAVGEPGSVSVPADATVIDLSQGWVLPGLIDCHVHLASQQSPQSFLESVTLNPADYAYRAVAYARKTLLAGFTAVRNLGESANVVISLRKAIQAGLVPGPRIYASGNGITSTGGHGDPSNGLSEQLQALLPQPSVIDGPEQGRKAVRERYKDGADVIKITATGGVLSQAISGQAPLLTPEELKAIVETAHDYGLKVAAHAHGTEGMKRAVLAGVDSIEHGSFMTDEVIELMKQRGTYYVPTLSAGKFVAEKAKIDGYFTPVVRPKAAAIGPVMQATFQRAWQGGVKIAFGTDQGVGPHGENALEFVYMVEAGMTPLKALQSATLEASRLLGAEKEIGSLEVGKFADMIAVPADPLKEIHTMTNVVFVMKGGAVHKHAVAAHSK